MKRFQSILVWISASDRARVALDQATAVARESGAALTLAFAVEPPQRLFRALYPHADELHEILKREWADRLEALAAPLRAEGIFASTRVLEGRPFVAFTQEVLRAGHDMLVKPADDSADGMFFGSSDMHVLRKCPCAVWITHPAVPDSKSILALVDPDPESEELNRRILQIGSSLAELRGGTFDVLHVWAAGGEDLLASRLRGPELADYVEQARVRSTRELAELLALSGVNLPDDRMNLVKGDVRSVVPEFVRERDVGLIVMGTVSRAGIQGLLIGNTAETILGRVRCPVLTLKHQGFVSPIAV